MEFKFLESLDLSSYEEIKKKEKEKENDDFEAKMDELLNQLNIQINKVKECSKPDEVKKNIKNNFGEIPDKKENKVLMPNYNIFKNNKNDYKNIDAENNDNCIKINNINPKQKDDKLKTKKRNNSTINYKCKNYINNNNNKNPFLNGELNDIIGKTKINNDNDKINIFNKFNNMNMMNNNKNNIEKNMNIINNNMNSNINNKINKNNMYDDYINYRPRMININSLKNMDNNNNDNDNDNYQIKWNIFVIFHGKKINIIINPEKKILDLINKISIKINNVDIEATRLIYNYKDILDCDKSKKISEYLVNNAQINLYEKSICGGYLLEKEINIKFIKVKKNYINRFLYQNRNKKSLYGLLNLCLLKEIALRMEYSQIDRLPIVLSSIMEVLKNGKIKSSEAKECIKEVLNKMRGSNIINFSRYVNKIIDSNNLEIILSNLYKRQIEEIYDIKNRLAKYNEYIKLFEKEFEKTKKESIFEFSIISLVIIEREDFETFENERRECPNKIDRMLYHGTSIEPISCILTDYFRKSIKKCCQHGEGVYFTDCLDYCWFYGGKEDNRANKDKIPKIDDTFTLIASSIYYNEKGFRIVSDYKYTPEKNEINFAYAGAFFETLDKLDKSKFYGTEYVINDLDQICPFIGAKLKRDEFCVIWRDTNFSENPIYNNDFDEKFKQFLKDRVIYVEELARFNIYLFDNSKEALDVIKRKKYNKIILISNVGTDLGGREFITEARRIIGNDVIALFLAYNISHLQWIKNYKNALFSNDPRFYEKYLECFSKENEYMIKDSLETLKESIEDRYDVTFNFDDTFLDFPLFKDNGKFSELTFD